MVEDDEGVSELVRERLEDLGCPCREARDGVTALAALGEEGFDLIVLDYSLPDMRADSIIAAESRPPFVIMTGRGDEATAVRLMRAGARDYVIKDSDFLDELPLVVARVLREIEVEDELARARASLEARLRENEAMLREIHHRVKNNLQIISSLVQLQVPTDADDRVRGIFLDIQNRISAMSLLHETLYEAGDLAEVDFLAYIETLARSLAATMAPSSDPCAVACGGDSIALSMDRAVPLGLIANELLTNAFKHAFPPPRREGAKVSVRIGTREGGGAYLEIEDNGVGIGTGLGPRVETCSGRDQESGGRDGLGLKLVRILAEQLRARLRIMVPASGRGTCWRIELGSE